MQTAKSTAVRLVVTLTLRQGRMDVEEHEQVGGSVAPILAIATLKLARLGRDR